jgi:hypothetical protein
MDFLTWMFLESRPLLGGCLAVVLFVLLVYWRRTLKPKPFLVGLALAVVLLVVQALVVTQREHADRIMRSIERDVLASRTEAIAAALSDRFQIPEKNWDRERFIERVKDYMQTIDVRTLNRRKLQIEKSETDAFEISVSYLAEISGRDYAGPVLSRWKIYFVHEDGHWRILRIEPTSLGQTTIHGWDGVPRP